jgi:hypothetical protein
MFQFCSYKLYWGNVIAFNPLNKSLTCMRVHTHTHTHIHTNSRIVQCVRKVAVHLGYGTQIWLSVSKLPLKCAVVSLYSVVKQQLKCNTGKVRNCLIQFLLTIVRAHHFQHVLKCTSTFRTHSKVCLNVNTRLTTCPYAMTAYGWVELHLREFLTRNMLCF